jgi:hypothetical protein
MTNDDAINALAVRETVEALAMHTSVVFTLTCEVRVAHNCDDAISNKSLRLVAQNAQRRGWAIVQHNVVCPKCRKFTT